MRPKLLFPSFFRVIGIILLIPGLVLGFFYAFYNYSPPFLGHGPGYRLIWKDNFSGELIVTLLICGSLLIGFSRQKNETRLTQSVRLNALYWTILVNAVLVIACGVYTVCFAVFKINFTIWTKLPAYYFIYNQLIIFPIFLARLYYLSYKVNQASPPGPICFIPRLPFNTIGKTIGVLFLLVFAGSFIPAAHIDTSSDPFTFSYFFLFLPSLLFCIWSREENEVGLATRLRAMQIAFYVNCILLLYGTWALYSSNFLTFFAFIFSSLLVIFVVVFWFWRYRTSKKAIRLVAPAGGSQGS